VLDRLGERFEVQRTSLKPFPTCRFTHAPAPALQELLAEQQLRAPDISRIEARITSAAFAEACEPLAEKVRPRSPALAQISLPYALACVADHGTVTLADLTEEGIRREQVLALAERVLCVRDPALEPRWGERIGEAEVRLVRRDGGVVAGRALPPGGPERPMTEQALQAKVEQCLAWGTKGVEAAQLVQAVNAVRYSGEISILSRCLNSARPASESQ
jgi:2-methylcitrate dehydratase PrpD